MLIDWSRVDLVMLDMDGTLLDLHFDNHFWRQLVPQHWAQARGLDVAQARHELEQRYHKERGSLSWYSVDFWSEELGLDLLTLKQSERGRIRLRPHTQDFLQALAGSGRQRWLVTNAHHHSLALKLDVTGIGAHFDLIICSHELAAAKESAAFWQRLQDRHPFPASACLLVDDNEEVLDTACVYGIGQVLCIRQPDSQQARRNDLRHPAIDDFHEIMGDACRHITKT